MDKSLIYAYAKAYCLDSIAYYNSLAEQHITHPSKRAIFLQWSQSKQQDLIDIQEMEEST